MKYLPILDELFSSDSIIFLLIGLVIAFVIGFGLKSVKKIAIGIIASIIVYALCELISNIIACVYMFGLEVLKKRRSLVCRQKFVCEPSTATFFA